MRGALLLLVLAACGGSADDKPTVYRNADPTFVLDVPAGYTAKPTRQEPLGGTVLDFETGRSSLSLSVTWKPGGSPADELAEWKAIHKATDEGRSKIVGEGELPGGGTWVATDFLTSSVWSWLKVGDLTLECFSSGGGVSRVPAALVNACKTLRPAP
jgi:hypothetical protein